jgi:photosystem II stability/assembly factor-like uncharacterized protein
VLLGLTACGGGDGTPSGDDGKRSSRLVDLTKKPPWVNALDIDPADGSFLLTTNRGFYRIDPRTKAVTRVRGAVAAARGRSPVGTFLELDVAGPGRLLGSGHPDDPKAGLPAYLGLMRSDDGGRRWRVVSRLGEADLHKIVQRHRRLYAFDAVLGAMLISFDGGRTFTERFTPRGLVIDFVVDPKDPEYLLAATEEQLHRSEDGGRKWRGVAAGAGIRLAWEGDTLLRADQNGTIQRSTDRGQTFAAVGKVPGEPYKFKSLDARRHFLALSDGTIVGTDDAGKTWTTTFDPDAKP